MVLDLTASSVDLTRAICDIPSVSGDEKTLVDAIEAAITPAVPPRGLPPRQHDRRPHRTRARSARRDRRTHRHRADQREPPDQGHRDRRCALPLGAGNRRHEGGHGRAAQARRRAHRSRDRHHLDVVRQRGDRGVQERPRPARRRATRPVPGGLRHPRRTVQRRGRGRMQRHAARDRAHDRRSRAQCTSVDRRERDPPCCSDPDAARGVPRQGGAGRGPSVSGEPERRAHRRRCRGQRHPRRVRGRGQLSLRSQQVRGGRRRRTCAGFSPASRSRSPMQPRVRAPDSTPRSRSSSLRLWAAEPRPKYGLDRRRPLLGARHSGGELRSRRPAPRAPRRGARAARADRRPWSGGLRAWLTSR